MRVKIEIDGSYLDLYNSIDEEFYITKQINDLRNLQNRQADYTRQFSIPKTPNNLDLLGMLTNERMANEAIECILLIDNMQIFKASLIIIDYDKEQIKITLLSGNYDFFNAIPDKSIKELNLSSYNIAWTVANMNAYDNTTEGLIIGYLNSLDQDSLDDGTGIPTPFTSSIDIKNFGFCFYLKTLAKKIIEQTGYTFDDTNVSSLDEYDDTVIVCPVMIEGYTDAIVFAIVDFTSSDFTYDGSIEGGAPKRINFDATVSDGSGIWSNVNFEFTIPTAGNWRLIFEYDLTYNRDAEGNECFIEVLNNASNLDSKTYTTSQTNISEIIDVTFYANASDLIYIEMTCDGDDVATLFIGSQVKLQQDIFDPNELRVIDWLPDISQKQLLIEFLMQMNLLLSSDPLTKTVSVKTWDQMTEETEQDITNNLDVSRQIIESQSIGTYFKTSLLAYNNEAKRTDTNYEIDFSHDSLLQKYGTILQSIFSGSDNETLEIPAISARYRSAKNFSITIATNNFSFGNSEEFKAGDYITHGSGVNFRIDRIQSVGSKTTGQFYNNAPATLTNADVQIIEFTFNSFKPRIAVLNRSLTWSPFLSIDGYSGGVQTASLYRPQFINTMNYIYNTYYINMFNALKTAKIITAWFIFNPLEFIQIDMTKPVTVDGFNGTFYINKIEQYKLNAPCRVELIRINSFQ